MSQRMVDLLSSLMGAESTRNDAIPERAWGGVVKRANPRTQLNALGRLHDR
jgi:hypothetical protein